jgi:hypothetical protein
MGKRMYWLGVSAAYLALLGIGLFLGHWLAGRFPGRGGSDFDRTFLPGAFVHDVSAELV